MTSLNELNRIIKEEKSGSWKLKLNEEEVEIFNQKKTDKVSIMWKKIGIIDLVENTLRVKLIDMQEFWDEFFSQVEDFLINDKGDVFNFPETLFAQYPELKDHKELIRDEVMQRASGTDYKGYKTRLENGTLRKDFIAKYKALIFNKGNKPYVKVTRLSEDSKLYTPARRGFVSEGRDSITCLYKNFETLTSANGIKSGDIFTDEDSIKQFYSFDDNYFVSPTKKWVEMWWNYDCPILYRYTSNLDGTSNMWGFSWTAWQKTLVESSWNYTEVDEYITEKEVDIFAGEYKHTEIYRQMQNILKSRKISNEEKEDNIKKAEEIEDKIQTIIDDNRELILKKAAKSFTGEDEHEPINILRELDGSMGPDCGFLYMSLIDEADLFKEIANYDTSHRMKNGSMKLNYPGGVQSTTIMRAVAKAIKDIVEAKTHHEMTYWTVLD